jgi:DNA invertase Pin-like site-specific DNA recombinase
VFHIFAGLVEFERSIIQERTRAGLAAARERGRLGGRPLALSREDLAAVKAMLRDSAITVEQIARRLGVAPSTLYQAPSRRPQHRGGRIEDTVMSDESLDQKRAKTQAAAAEEHPTP